IYKSTAQNPFRAEDFCIIIIEAQILETQKKPPKAHRSPIDVLWWSPNLQHAYSNALLCITKTHHIGKHILHLSIMCS
ncbi:MAG: hypothetical protein IJY67_07590, partial [Paludibacteraceae bacterium]|nr:hypothetical protein [Paludibacteraceae bacterium]